MSVIQIRTKQAYKNMDEHRGYRHGEVEVQFDRIAFIDNFVADFMADADAAPEVAGKVRVMAFTLAYKAADRFEEKWNV